MFAASVMRNLSIGFVGIVAAAVIILPPLLLMVISSTDIGERILTHMYLDESAECAKRAVAGAQLPQPARRTVRRSSLSSGQF